MLTIDAFNSDAIPTHLLTREAFTLYRSRLAPGGIVAFHVSNRFLDLAPVIGALADDAGWMAVEAVDRHLDGEAARRTRATAVSLIAVAATAESLQPLLATGNWGMLAGTSRGPWTDDWTPLASVLTVTRETLLGR